MAKFLLWFAVLVWSVGFGAQVARAHPLPGSRLTITPEAGSVELNLAIPVPELLIVLPSLGELRSMPKNTNIPSALQNDLASYLRKHMVLTPAKHSALDLKLIRAKVQEAHNEDVDHYDLLIVEMAAPLPANQSLFPAVLTYDAVLHEVRNHRASVWLAQPGKAAVLLGKIRFDASLGQARPLELPGIP